MDKAEIRHGRYNIKYIKYIKHIHIWKIESVISDYNGTKLQPSSSETPVKTPDVFFVNLNYPK